MIPDAFLSDVVAFAITSPVPSNGIRKAGNKPVRLPDFLRSLFMTFGNSVRPPIREVISDTFLRAFSEFVFSPKYKHEAPASES